MTNEAPSIGLTVLKAYPGIRNYTEIKSYVLYFNLMYI